MTNTSGYITRPHRRRLGTILLAGFSLLSLSAQPKPGSVSAWGRNNYGQLGNGTNIDSYAPVTVSGLTQVVGIASGSDHNLAVKVDGTVWAWGLNNHGQLGNGTNVDSNTPVQVGPLPNGLPLTGVVAVAAGGFNGVEYSLALTSNGTVWAWGSNLYGQLGNGTNGDSSTPVAVSGLSGVVAIAGGYYHGLALTSNGTVWAWGYNGYGQLGSGTYVGTNTPFLLNGLTGIVALAGGTSHSLAVKNDGTVWAWGYDAHGQLGNGTYMEANNVPAQVSNLTQVAAIAGGSLHSLALTSSGTVRAWG